MTEAKVEKVNKVEYRFSWLLGNHTRRATVYEQDDLFKRAEFETSSHISQYDINDWRFVKMLSDFIITNYGIEAKK